mgnify:CR=1 FL=1
MEKYEGKYKIKETIGKIYAVTFYRAIEIGSNKEVTLKISWSGNYSGIKYYILPEIKFLKRINNIPGIIKQLGVGFLYEGNLISDKTIK